MRVAPPSRRKACSCSSAQMRVLELEGQQANGLAAVAQRQHEQPVRRYWPRVRIAHHGAGAVIDLRFLAGRRDDDRHAGFAAADPRSLRTKRLTLW